MTYQPGNLFSNLGHDTYFVIVKDTNGCKSAVTTVTIIDPTQIFVGFNAPAITTCFGAPGSIALTGAGGSGNLEYSISTIQFVPGAWQASGVFNNLLGGVPYFGFVRDVVTGCIVYANNGNSITINQPAEIMYNVTILTHVTVCSYNTNGEIRISLPTGGSPPFTYFINGVSNGTSRVFRNLAVGSYLIEAVDSRGCRKPTTVTVNGPPPIRINSLVKTDINTCHGDNTGSIILTASGGTGTLSFSLNGAPPVGSGSFTNLIAGDYLIRIRDNNNCFKDTTVTITQPPLMTIAVSRTNITCFGSNNGTITVTITGGVMPYSYSINNGLNYFSTNSFTGLASGSYSVVGRDANGCIQHGGVINIHEPPPLIITSETSVNPTTCPGIPGNGSITITASGGSAPLQYSIDGGLNYFSNGGLFTRLSVGTYQIIVRDNRGCIANGSTITLDGIQPIVLGVTSSNITCNGLNDGLILLNASGGGGNFEFSIDNGVNYFANGNFTNLSAGNYQIIARDILGCTQSGVTISIIEPAVLGIDTIQITHIVQGGPTNIGELNIFVSGGTTPYVYSIDGGSTFNPSGHFTGLTSGNYNVVVRDINGCEVAISVSLNEIPPFDVVVNVTDITCFGFNDGSILLTASLGTEPYEYSIDGGLNYGPAGTFSGLAGGIYEVRVRDAAGFIFSSSVTVVEPADIIVIGVVTNATCNLSTSDGSIIIDVSGGAGPYNYLWSDGTPTKDLINAFGGNYSVMVTDANGCFRDVDFFVDWMHEVNVDLGNDFSACQGLSVQLNAVFSQSGSTANFSWVSTPSAVIASIHNPIVIPAIGGSEYTVTLTDENGCTASSSISIDVYDVPAINAGNDTTLIAGTSVTLSAEPDLFVSYTWSPATGLNTTDGISVIATPLVSTNYYVTGLTSDGCLAIDSVFIKIALPINPASGLTPNDDGINDFWEIENAEDYPTMVVEVYNRFGQKLFHSLGYSNNQRWDGYFRGKPLPVGTYYFVIKLNNVPGSTPITGPVTIVR